MRVLIIGAGGHAQVIAEAVLRCADHGDDVSLAGFLDDDLARSGTVLFDRPVHADIASIPHDAVTVAIGDNGARAKVFAALRDAGKAFATIVHPSSIIAPDVRLGQGAMVCAGVIVNTGAQIGDDAILNTGATIDHHSVIGAHAHVAPGVHLAGSVTVGEGVLLGIGSVAVPGVSIAPWSFVRAGSIVSKDVGADADPVGPA